MNKLFIDLQEVQAVLYVVYICICVFLSFIYVKSDQRHKHFLRVSIVKHDYSMFDIQATIFKWKLYKASVLMENHNLIKISSTNCRGLGDYSKRRFWLFQK